MTFSNKLDLRKFLMNVQDLEYVIIKFNPDFPNYYSGNDIDIFTNNFEEFTRRILEVGNEYALAEFRVKVDNLNSKKVFIDFYFKEELEFRFDIHTEFPTYKKIKVKHWLFYSIIDRRVAIIKEFDNTPYHIYVPSEEDDLILRFLEYNEFYDQRIDKIKHLEYVERALFNDSMRNSFFDRLFLYTELPTANQDKNGHYHRSKAIRLFGPIIKKIRKTPFKKIPLKIIKKILRLFNG